MPPKKKIEPQPLIPKEDYWERFLISQGLVGVITEAIEMAPPKNEKTLSRAIEEHIDPDILNFIYRVTERLTPLAEYEPEARKKLLAVREQYRQELTDVFEGKEPLDTWFNRTRNNRGMHMIDLLQIFYESLQGLRSPEAKELRVEYGKALQQARAMYKPA